MQFEHFWGCQLAPCQIKLFLFVQGYYFRYSVDFFPFISVCDTFEDSFLLYIFTNAPKDVPSETMNPCHATRGLTTARHFLLNKRKFLEAHEDLSQNRPSVLGLMMTW